jgi:hypothetical protein
LFPRLASRGPIEAILAVGIHLLAKRLPAEPSKSTPKTAQPEMEAALIRLNPHLDQIGELKKGTPILVPEEFKLAPDESLTPMRGIAEELLRQAEIALTNLRATLQEHLAQSAEQSDQAQTFLKSDAAKEFVRGASDLKEVFSSAPAAAKALPKEQAAAIAAQDKALGKVASQLADFRRA